MCVPGCLEHVHERVASRRNLLRGAGALAAGAAAASLPVAPAAAQSPRSFSRVVDLTHPLSPEFPTFGGTSGVSSEVMMTLAKDGYNMRRWSFVEHTGTHMDAPSHFSDGISADALAVERLVVPVVVIDIAAKAEGDPGAQVTPDDIRAFEARHGAVPPGACVAMHSGWARHVSGPKFRNADETGAMRFPGFHVEAARLLMEERDVVGIAVDTLSLDHGQSQDFAVHYAWLGSGRWGLEGVANLDRLPPSGATIVAGGPTFVGATGGPTRVLALI